MRDRIIFLDFDGVVNTPYWRDYNGKFTCRFAYPEDGFVNNHQAICWLNDLFIDMPFDIVVTSTWRECEDEYTAEECLYNGGLDKDIFVTKLPSGLNRGDLIWKWLQDNNFEGKYVILDDDDYYTKVGAVYTECEYHPELKNRFVQTDSNTGIHAGTIGKVKAIFNSYDI